MHAICPDGRTILNMYIYFLSIEFSFGFMKELADNKTAHTQDPCDKLQANIKKHESQQRAIHI